MFQLLFAVAILVGAIAAIRRNPSYTRSSLLRTIPALLLGIAVVVGLIIAAVHFANGHSNAAGIAAIVAAILVGCLFFIYILYTASTPKEARLTHTLPPGAKIVDLHRRRLYRWTKILAIVLVALGTLGLVLPGTPGLVALMFGAFLLFISAILLPIYYFTSRMMDVSLTALQADPWVHWTYTPEQWQQWSEIQVTRLEAAPSTVKPKWGVLALIMIAISAAIYFIYPGGYLWKTVYIAFISFIMVAVMISSARGAKGAPGKLRARLRATSPEVFFGRDGLFANGDYTFWRSTDVFLNSAGIDTRDPGSILFRFERDVPNPYGPLNIIHINQAVLIPAGAEPDLTLLQQNLTARCPSAQINLT